MSFIRQYLRIIGKKDYYKCKIDILKECTVKIFQCTGYKVIRFEARRR